jgi:predicted GTPase
MDLPEAKENLKRFKKQVKGKILQVSALEKQGLDKLIAEIKKILCRERLRSKSNALSSS